MALDDLPISLPGGSGLAFDARNLAALRAGVRRAPQTDSGQQREVARQFEALFLQMMIRRMREASGQGGLFDSDQTRLARTLADEQMALQLASPGIGLAQALLAQIRRHRESVASAGRDVGSVPAGSVAAQPGVAALGPAGGRVSRGPSVAPEVAALLDSLVAGRAGAAPAGDAGTRVAEFVARMGRAARSAARAAGVPARLILGQAALESGWGEREIRYGDGRPSHNVFGIKAGPGWNGKVVHVATTEYENGVPRRTVQPFRAYGSYEESFADYARLIGGSPRYRAVAGARDEVEAARRIQEAGYATDPRYAEKLIGVMDRLRGHPG